MKKLFLFFFLAFIIASSAFSQQTKVVSGVVSGPNGPLAGVSVSAKLAGNTVATNEQGKYIITANYADTLLISAIGYSSMQIPVGNRAVIDVNLSTHSLSLDDVVVVGFAKQKKVNMTGAVDVITNRNLDGRQAPTVSQLLQGQSPGINFSLNNEGFQPGAEMGVKIRGMGSLNGGVPFVLIDGVPGNMDFLNPGDIESISVLKDAASASIYGARAAFGVILITTKSGSNNRFKVTYSTNLSGSFAQPLPARPNSVTQARAMNEAGANAGGVIYPDKVMDRMYAYIREDWDYLKQFTVPDATHFETIPLPNGLWGEYYEGHANNDWLKEYYGGVKFDQKHDLSLQGGSQNVKYYFSGGYIDQNGILNYGKDDFSRFNLLGKVSVAIAKWWDLTYSTRFMKSKREKFNMGNEGSYDLAFHQIARVGPMMPKYDGYGNLLEKSMIPEIANTGTDYIERTENWHILNTELRPLRNWKINVDFASQFTDGFQSNTDLNDYFYRVDKTPVVIGISTPNGVTQYHLSNSYMNASVHSTYNLLLGSNHNFTFLVGNQVERAVNRNLSAAKTGLLVQDEVISLQTATGNPNVSEELLNWSTLGYFGRLNYDYKGTYLLEANIRRDGTSRFQEGKRWGTFPSVSAGWNISNEKFWTPLQGILNTFKLRGSWGKLGNQDVKPYQDLELIPISSAPLNWLWSYGGSRPIGYTSIPPLVSPLLTWETTTNKNLGVNLTALRNRLSVSFDLFERKTDRMLGPSQSLPGVLGARMPNENNAALKTTGWEISVAWRQELNNKFSYYVNANLFDSRSVVTKYYNPTGSLSTWYEGKEEGEIWGYTAYDLYRTPADLEYTQKVNLSFLYGGNWRTGDVKYEDVNGDGAVNNGTNTIYNHGDLTIIGNTVPHYEFGLSAGINFKNFDFSMLWKGALKRQLSFANNQNLFWGFRQFGQMTLYNRHLDYYRDQPGTKYVGLYEGDANINLNSYFPRPYMDFNENRKNYYASTRYLQNAAYCRLQNIQIGYSFSNTMLSKIKLQSVRFFLSGENLLTITKLKGFDPIAIGGSFGMGKTYGADRMVSFGLTISY